MQEFFRQFEDYCKTPGMDTGKARSYAKSIEYLCDYLNITIIDSTAIAHLKSIENDVRDPSSTLYHDLLLFLTRRGQKSYLSNGWIRSGLTHFFNFISLQ